MLSEDNSALCLLIFSPIRRIGSYVINNTAVDRREQVYKSKHKIAFLKNQNLRCLRNNDAVNWLNRRQNNSIHPAGVSEYLFHFIFTEAITIHIYIYTTI